MEHATVESTRCFTVSHLSFVRAINQFDLIISLVNEDRENGATPTRFSEWMNKPGIIQRPGHYDMFLRGIATQPQQAQDIFFTEEVVKRGNRFARFGEGIVVIATFANHGFCFG